VAYQVNPVDARGIDKGDDVSHELVEPVGPPAPRPGLRGVTALVRCDDPITGRKQWPGNADPRLRTLREPVQEHDRLRVYRPLVRHLEPHAVAESLACGDRRQFGAVERR
jgi:hypothetical protein